MRIPSPALPGRIRACFRRRAPKRRSSRASPASSLALCRSRMLANSPTSRPTARLTQAPRPSWATRCAQVVSLRGWRRPRLTRFPRALSSLLLRRRPSPRNMAHPSRIHTCRTCLKATTRLSRSPHRIRAHHQIQMRWRAIP